MVRQSATFCESAVVPLHNMKTKNLFFIFLCSWLGVSFLCGQSTAFTYQGRLARNGTATDGIYDLRFALYDAGTGGMVQDTPVTNSAVAVSNGLFVVTLDFGSEVFDGSARWLEI